MGPFPEIVSRPLRLRGWPVWPELNSFGTDVPSSSRANFHGGSPWSLPNA
jgi:hypothetical protein